jgi:hypothetical protein
MKTLIWYRTQSCAICFFTIFKLSWLFVAASFVTRLALALVLWSFWTFHDIHLLALMPRRTKRHLCLYVWILWMSATHPKPVDTFIYSFFFCLVLAFSSSRPKTGNFAATNAVRVCVRVYVKVGMKLMWRCSCWLPLRATASILVPKTELLSYCCTLSWVVFPQLRGKGCAKWTTS